MRRLLLATIISVVVVSVPASAQVQGVVTGPDGVLFAADSSGTVDVSVERWDGDSQEFVAVFSTSREVERGEEYFVEFLDVEQEGHYRATLELDGEAAVSRFRHKVRALPRIGDSSYSADSGGGALFISPLDASMVDARFLVLRGGRVVDSVEVEDRLVSTPSKLEVDWERLLSAGEGYGSVAVLSAGDGERLLVDSFTGVRDASVTDLSADEDSASVEVEGDSQVPLNGEVSLTLIGEGGEVESFEEGVPALTTGDSEEFSFLWRDVLEPGSYVVEARVSGGGEVLDNERLAFELEQEAEITGVFGDSNGGSVTVEGGSEIPLNGSVRISLERGGDVVQEKVVSAPVVLKGNEETVEVAWDGDLEPGDYVVRAVLSTEEGGLDRAGNVFTVEGSGATPTSSPTGASPGPGALVFAALAVAGFSLRRK